MITGTVNATYEAVVRLTVRGAGGQEQEVEAIVDTGFNAYLTLPPGVIGSLGCPLVGLSRVALADGREGLVDLYQVAVIWDGQPRMVEADAASPDPLIGMELLSGHELRIDVVNGGAVTITPLS